MAAGWLRTLAKLTAVVAVVYAGIVAAVMLSPAFQAVFVYLHVLRIPFPTHYTAPHLHGLHGARPVTITTQDGLTLGAWHILPAGPLTLHAEMAMVRGEAQDEVFDRLLQTSQAKIIIYFHGNAGTRGVGHRVDFYRTVTSHLGAHVLTFDYRGFGESEGTPTEDGLNLDAFAAYEWVLSRIGEENSGRVLIWGHSLGSGVSSRFISELCLQHAKEEQRIKQHLVQAMPETSDALSHILPLPSALILDAPFSTLRDGALHHPAGTLFQIIPKLDWLLDRFLAHNFPSVERIKTIDIPILIVHGRQDKRLPIELGEQLYNSAIDARTERARLGQRFHTVPVTANGFRTKVRETHGVRFVELPDGDHNTIWMQPGILSSVQQFVQDFAGNVHRS
ncbi:abhydrolase domain-containing protein 12B [Capsaspora owczarzaki ATCC 30864]|uniref:Abhydrolase domain-containing protein 12B n=1 Tax=Capsaspora owczarzaki (strain ATCC 30864) TaxID=595528 RepID=A0A0D2VXF6_CAPO3|nr:abhydrolase domain-containing protein 12B [Capsaspora owczarzaki ATCC 30864]KJE96342.1 abhydrolase domain-containing protein 12B [Capsaspora owczarzaki ATCC 30864]|eukprot:XP_004344303.1 abhydrolase domain-containing protein 12B [Capsaspora owczarzaki ATCC 30864]